VFPEREAVEGKRIEGSVSKKNTKAIWKRMAFIYATFGP